MDDGFLLFYEYTVRTRSNTLSRSRFWKRIIQGPDYPGLTFIMGRFSRVKFCFYFKKHRYRAINVIGANGIRNFINERFSSKQRKAIINFHGYKTKKFHKKLNANACHKQAFWYLKFKLIFRRTSNRVTTCQCFVYSMNIAGL